MRVARLFVAERLREGAHVSLPPEATHHTARVLRLRDGDPLVLFDGQGGEYEATVTRQRRAELAVEVGLWRAVERESPLHVTLAQGIASADRMDLTIQKAVELGVSVIQPLLAGKSVVRLDGARASAKLEHWRRIVVASSEQCGRNRLAAVLEPCTVAEYCRGHLEQRTRWLLEPGAPGSLRDAAGPAPGPFVVSAGPEAGFDAGEREVFLRAEFVPVHLGPRTLRTETAALVAIATLHALHGDA